MIKLVPECKEYIWGGTRLKEEYNKKSDLATIAETWELSNHKDGQSKILGGIYDGVSFSEYLEKEGKEILGTNCEKFPYFPILIKLIDAKDNLSIQVHPDNEYAMRVENEYGKTEMWYVLEHEEGAFLYYGFKKDISKEELEERIENNTLLEVLNKVEVKKGDVFFIKAGTIHAIGAGILICEIQQNSNTTYRVYDYGRTDKNGNTRELHVEKAKDVAKLNKMITRIDKKDDEDSCKLESTVKELASCEYFTTHYINVKKEYSFLVLDNSFVSLIITNGSGIIKNKNEITLLNKGDSIFIKAGEGRCCIEGNLEMIQTEI